jgi:hypothetical protein
MKKLFSPLFAEFDAEGSTGGGTAVAEQPTGERGTFSSLSDFTDDDDEIPAEISPEPIPAPTPTTPPDDKPLTRVELEAALAKLTPAPTPVPEPAPLTQEQLDEQLQRYRPDQLLINTLLGDASEEDKLAALEKMTQGIYKYSTNTANQLAQYYVQQLRQEMQPALTAAQQAQASTWENEFYTANPALKGQAALIQAATAQLKTSGVQPKTKEEAFKLVAETAIKIGQAVNPAFGQPQKSSRMAKLSTGGQGGSSAPASGASKRGASDIWGS